MGCKLWDPLRMWPDKFLSPSSPPECLEVSAHTQHLAQKQLSYTTNLQKTMMMINLPGRVVWAETSGTLLKQGRTDFSSSLKAQQPPSTPDTFQHRNVPAP